MKGLLVLLLMLVLAGCGDFEWFPDDSSTTTTTPPATPTQQAFNNTSTASGVSLPTLPVVNATDNLSVTEFRYYEISRDTTTVSVGFDLEVANANAADTNVKVTIAAKDASQTDLLVTTTDHNVPVGRLKWYHTDFMSINDYGKIKSWTVAAAKVP